MHEQPIKELEGDELNNYLAVLYKTGQKEQIRINKITPLKDDGIMLCDRPIYIQTNPFVSRMREKHWDLVLDFMWKLVKQQDHKNRYASRLMRRQAD